MYPTQTMTTLVQLAEELDENKVSPGLLGFLVFAMIGGAVWLLLRSLNKHMNRVDFEEAPEGAAMAEPAPSRSSRSSRPGPEGSGSPADPAGPGSDGAVPGR